MLQKDIMDRISSLPENDKNIILELVGMIEADKKNNREMRDRISESIEQAAAEEND